MIVFENIDTGETVGISKQLNGEKYYRAMLSAVMNSSNLNPNADRGQDFGWRLKAEQQAMIEQWEQDPDMIDKVSTWSKTMVDDLTHSEFLAYLLYQQELGRSPEKTLEAERRKNQLEYQARVDALKAAERPVPMSPFSPKVALGEETIDDFLNGDLTGDASGDKVEEPEVTEQDKAELDKVISEVKGTKPADDQKPITPKKTPAKK